MRLAAQYRGVIALNMQSLSDLLVRDKSRIKALKALRELDLPQGFIAAGFLRNLVWDHLHGKQTATELNDIDVIYYCHEPVGEGYELEHEYRLNSIYEHANWQVKNQAFMHHKNGDAPYNDVVHAMSYWPEKETAVAVRLKPDDSFEYATPFSIDLLYDYTITYNSARSKAVFDKRVSSKCWQKIWPKLQIKL